jgi:peptidoglycan hydrolase-like protein with peptidoglycan-binding domain
MAQIANDVNKVLLAKPYPGLFPTAPISRNFGTTSNIIRWQSFLKWYGFNIAIDGHFGAETERLTKLFQSQNRLVPDGIAGKLTIAKAKTVKR